MPRRAVTVLLAAALLAVVAALVTAAADRRELAFTSGVSARIAAAQLAPGDRACQVNVEVVEPFDAVELVPGGARSAPALEVQVLAGGEQLGGGRLAAGAAAGRPVRVPVQPVTAGRRVAVCVTAGGPGPLVLQGGPPETVLDSRLYRGAAREQELPADLQLVFVREDAPSLLHEIPTVFRRAALFHPGWMGAWTFWLLLAMVAIGVPALLARGLRDALRAERAPAELAAQPAVAMAEDRTEEP